MTSYSVAQYNTKVQISLYSYSYLGLTWKKDIFWLFPLQNCSGYRPLLDIFLDNWSSWLSWVTLFSSASFLLHLQVFSCVSHLQSSSSSACVYGGSLLRVFFIYVRCYYLEEDYCGFIMEINTVVQETLLNTWAFGKYLMKPVDKKHQHC